MADTEPIEGYLVEYDFIREGMRQDQRERQGFLGFTLGASGLILGLLMRSDPPRMPDEVCFLVGLAAVVTVVGERLTLRASQGVAVAGAYLRVFVEPHVEGLEYQGRNPRFKLKGRVSSSRGFAIAYACVTAAFVAAWFVAPVKGDREWWQHAVVGSLAAVSLWQVARLAWASHNGWGDVDAAWEQMFKDDRAPATQAPPPASSPGTPRR